MFKKKPFLILYTWISLIFPDFNYLAADDHQALCLYFEPAAAYELKIAYERLHFLFSCKWIYKRNS